MKLSYRENGRRPITYLKEHYYGNRRIEKNPVGQEEYALKYEKGNERKKLEDERKQDKRE